MQCLQDVCVGAVTACLRHRTSADSVLRRLECLPPQLLEKILKSCIRMGCLNDDNLPAFLVPQLEVMLISSLAHSLSLSLSLYSFSLFSLPPPLFVLSALYQGTQLGSLQV